MASLSSGTFAAASIANSSMPIEKMNGVVSGSNSMASEAPTALGTSDSSRKLQEQERLFNEWKQQQQQFQQQQQQQRRQQLIQHFQQQSSFNESSQMNVNQSMATTPSNSGSMVKPISQPETNSQHMMAMQQQQHERQQLFAPQHQQIAMFNQQQQQRGQQQHFGEQHPVVMSSVFQQQQQMTSSNIPNSNINANNSKSPLALISKQQQQQQQQSQESHASQQKQYQQFLYQKFLAFQNQQEQQQQMQMNNTSSTGNVPCSTAAAATFPVPIFFHSATSSTGVLPQQTHFAVSKQQNMAAMAMAAANAQSSSHQKSVDTMNPLNNSINNLQPPLLSPQIRQPQQQMPMLSSEQSTGTAFNQIAQQPIQNGAFGISATTNTGNNMAVTNNNSFVSGDPSSIQQQQIPTTVSSSIQPPPNAVVQNLPWPLFQPTVCVPYFDMDTYQEVNLDVLPSAMSNGLDLPFNEIPTLRFFFNFGVQHARTVLLKQHLRSNNSAQQQQQQQPQRFSGNVVPGTPGGGTINNNPTTMLAVPFNNKSQGQPLSSRIQNTLQHSNVPPPPKAIGQNITAKTMYPAGAAFSAGTTTTQQMSSPNQTLMNAADASASMGAQSAAAQQHQQQEQLSAYFQQQFAAAAMTNGFGHSNGFTSPPGAPIRKRQRAKRNQSSLQQKNQAVNSDHDQLRLCTPIKRQRKTALKKLLKNNTNRNAQQQNEQMGLDKSSANSFPMANKTNSALLQQKILEKQQQHQNFMQLQQQQQNFLMAAYPEKTTTTTTATENGNGMGAASASPLAQQPTPLAAAPQVHHKMLISQSVVGNDGYYCVDNNEEQQQFLQQLAAQQHKAAAANAAENKSQAKNTSHDRHGPMEQLNRPDSVTVISPPPALVAQNEAVSASSIFNSGMSNATSKSKMIACVNEQQTNLVNELHELKNAGLNALRSTQTFNAELQSRLGDFSQKLALRAQQQSRGNSDGCENNTEMIIEITDGMDRRFDHQLEKLPPSSITVSNSTIGEEKSSTKMLNIGSDSLRFEQYYYPPKQPKHQQNDALLHQCRELLELHKQAIEETASGDGIKQSFLQKESDEKDDCIEVDVEGVKEEDFNNESVKIKRIRTTTLSETDLGDALDLTLAKTNTNKEKLAALCFATN